MSLPLVALVVYGVMSIITFAAFALDKRAARAGRRRTPERTLHTLELLGGWPGALLAVRLVRHKGRKASYLAALTLIAALHAGAWALWFSRGA